VVFTTVRFSGFELYEFDEAVRLDFRSSISSAAGVVLEATTIIAIRSGSVIVDYTVLFGQTAEETFRMEAFASKTAAKPQSLLADVKSPLLKGSNMTVINVEKNTSYVRTQINLEVNTKREGRGRFIFLLVVTVVVLLASVLWIWIFPAWFWPKLPEPFVHPRGYLDGLQLKCFLLFRWLHGKYKYFIEVPEQCFKPVVTIWDGIAMILSILDFASDVHFLLVVSESPGNYFFYASICLSLSIFINISIYAVIWNLFFGDYHRKKQGVLIDRKVFNQASVLYAPIIFLSFTNVSHLSQLPWVHRRDAGWYEDKHRERFPIVNNGYLNEKGASEYVPRRFVKCFAVPVGSCTTSDTWRWTWLRCLLIWMPLFSEDIPQACLGLLWAANEGVGDLALLSLVFSALNILYQLMTNIHRSAGGASDQDTTAGRDSYGTNTARDDTVRPDNDQDVKVDVDGSSSAGDDTSVEEASEDEVDEASEDDENDDDGEDNENDGDGEDEENDGDDGFIYTKRTTETMDIYYNNLFDEVNYDYFSDATGTELGEIVVKPLKVPQLQRDLDGGKGDCVKDESDASSRLSTAGSPESDEAVLRAWRADCPALQELWGDDVAVREWRGITIAAGDDVNVGRVVKIMLRGSGLAEADTGTAARCVPAALGRLDALVVLDLHNNGLTSVPAALGELRSLTELDLSGNRLTNIPASLGLLSSLMRLDLDGNQLTSIPAALAELSSLQYLYLGKDFELLERSVDLLR